MTLLDPETTFLIVKMLTTAGFVVAASLFAEKAGPLAAALVATLPVSAGPIYFFLAMEHPDSFISDAALGSIGSNLATTGFSVAYVLAAQRWGALPALGLAFFAWAPILFGLRFANLPFVVLMGLTLGALPLLHIWLKRHLAARPLRPPRLAWYAIPVRAAFVATLVGTVTSLSLQIGPRWSGFFATFPVVLSSLIMFLHPRIGGPATAAILGSGILGLMGFGFALGVVHLTAVPMGKWGALSLGLGICVAWNLGIATLARRRPRAV
ncbi:MAG: hypothetical protein NT037_14410 [Hyphomicrobiales bacterium]|jgi:hypothetical protein|nr:hypothetical protein [Hyphomicrobiales bacterium]